MNHILIEAGNKLTTNHSLGLDETLSWGKRLHAKLHDTCHCWIRWFGGGVKKGQWDRRRTD